MMGNGYALGGNLKQFSDTLVDDRILARFIEVSSIELSDPKGSWIQAFPYVEYDHPIHGKIKFDRARAERMAANVAANVRGQDLDIDYDHKALRGDAAGWVKKAEARDDGLYIFVEWTKEAYQKLKDKAYRYFSPEYVDEWTHPNGQKFRDVLFGGALTNRPFLKGILPINLSEMVGDHDPSQSGEGTEGGNQVNREQLEKLAKNLGVEFTDEMSDEDLFSAIDSASTQGPGSEDDDTQDDTNDALLVQASEHVDDELKKLAESNPAVATLLAERERQNRRLAALEAANKLSEINIKLNEVDTDKHQLAPKYKDKLRSLAIKLSDDGMRELMALVKGIVEDGVIELGERGGRAADTRTSTGDAGEQFDALVKKLQEQDESLSFAEAVEEAARQNPELFDEYRSGSYADGGYN